MATGEVALTESLSQGADGLAEDNKHLQEMLHSALRREAEALRRVKHLSDLLSECRLANSGTPSSGQELPDGQWVAAGKRDEWEAGWDSSDVASLPHSQQSSEANMSPCLVVSPPLDTCDGCDDLASQSFFFPGAASAPSPLCDGREALATTELESTSENMSIPASLLAPALNTSGDVRRERERPPPSQLRRTPSPQPTYSPLESSTQPQVSKVKRMSVTLGRAPSSETDQPTSRSRAHSILLLPGWLNKKSLGSGRRRTRKTHSGTGPATITERFTHFLEHSSNISLHPFSKHINQPWSEVCLGAQCPLPVAKYRTAVWELFQSECKYLCNQLQPLEQVYKAFLEELQFYGVLAVADVQKIFANLSELVELSVSVATDLFKLFIGRHGDMIAPTNELILAFSMFGHKWNPVYQRFCVNMEQQRGFVKALQQLPQFQEYMSACRGHPMVHRSDLADLLIAPMQHQCHYQLLLENVLKVTSQPSEKSLLTSAIKAFVVALKELQANITAHQRSLELLELQETLSWPSLSSLCPDTFIPEGLSMDQQPCKNRLATATRQMLYSGAVCLIDSRGRHSNDIQLFLFTDMLLLTEPNKVAGRKESHRRELTRYKVYRQPLFLQWLEVHSLPSSHSPKHCLTLVQRNVLHQLVAVHTLQASSNKDRDKWVSSIQEAMYSCCQS